MKTVHKAVFTVLLLAITVLTYGCCNCGKNIAEGSAVSGKIIIIGNDPFTKLAIQTDDEKVYILECSEELRKELWNKQGDLYLVSFSDLKVVEERDVLVVEKVMPIKKVE